MRDFSSSKKRFDTLWAGYSPTRQESTGRSQRPASPINSRLESGESHAFDSSVVRRETEFVSKSLTMLECQSQHFSALAPPQSSPAPAKPPFYRRGQNRGLLGVGRAQPSLRVAGPCRPLFFLQATIFPVVKRLHLYGTAAAHEPDDR